MPAKSVPIGEPPLSGFPGRINQTPSALGEGPYPVFKNGRIPTFRDLENWAKNQGWTRRGDNPTGPIQYLDANGIKRLEIKQGSSRAPGSNYPHATFRDAQGRRIDPVNGGLTTRKGEFNHQQIIPYFPNGSNLLP